MNRKKDKTISNCIKSWYFIALNEQNVSLPGGPATPAFPSFPGIPGRPPFPGFPGFPWGP